MPSFVLPWCRVLALLVAYSCLNVESTLFDACCRQNAFAPTHHAMGYAADPAGQRIATGAAAYT